MMKKVLQGSVWWGKYGGEKYGGEKYGGKSYNVNVADVLQNLANGNGRW